MEELEEVIKSIHKGKATGPDNIPSRQVAKYLFMVVKNLENFVGT